MPITASLFFLSLFLILYTYVFFPIFLGIFSRFVKQKNKQNENLACPSISIIMVVRNAEHYIKDKIINTLSLDFPNNDYEICIASDGSTDRTEELIIPFLDSDPIKFFPYRNHQGKNIVINLVVEHCSGEVLVFTDVSAMIERRALKEILPWFTDKNIGGVCGRKRFKKSKSSLASAQNTFLSYEDFIRKCESTVASIASNEGFFYAIRRELMRPIPHGVTDDLYTAMSVVKQGYRFLFDPEACALLPLRAKTNNNELQRRRRIVCCSLNGIIKMKDLLNPIRYPVYSWILFSHKVLRRLIPIFLCLILLTNLLLIFKNHFYLTTAIIQVSGYFLFGFMLVFNYEFKSLPSLIRRMARTWYYFVLGNLGTFWGIVDLLTGKNYSRWDPITKQE